LNFKPFILAIFPQESSSSSCIFLSIFLGSCIAQQQNTRARERERDREGGFFRFSAFCSVVNAARVKCNLREESAIKSAPSRGPSSAAAGVDADGGRDSDLFWVPKKRKEKQKTRAPKQKQNKRNRKMPLMRLSSVGNSHCMHSQNSIVAILENLYFVALK